MAFGFLAESGNVVDAAVSWPVGRAPAPTAEDREPRAGSSFGQWLEQELRGIEVEVLVDGVSELADTGRGYEDFGDRGTASRKDKEKRPDQEQLDEADRIAFPLLSATVVLSAALPPSARLESPPSARLESPPSARLETALAFAPGLVVPGADERVASAEPEQHGVAREMLGAPPVTGRWTVDFEYPARESRFQIGNPVVQFGTSVAPNETTSKVEGRPLAELARQGAAVEAPNEYERGEYRGAVERTARREPIPIAEAADGDAPEAIAITGPDRLAIEVQSPGTGRRAPAFTEEAPQGAGWEPLGRAEVPSVEFGAEEAPRDGGGESLFRGDPAPSRQFVRNGSGWRGTSTVEALGGETPGQEVQVPATPQKPRDWPTPERSSRTLTSTASLVGGDSSGESEETRLPSREVARGFRTTLRKHDPEHSALRSMPETPSVAGGGGGMLAPPMVGPAEPGFAAALQPAAETSDAIVVGAADTGDGRAVAPSVGAPDPASVGNIDRGGYPARHEDVRGISGEPAPEAPVAFALRISKGREAGATLARRAVPVKSVPAVAVEGQSRIPAVGDGESVAVERLGTVPVQGDAVAPGGSQPVEAGGGGADRSAPSGSDPAGVRWPVDSEAAKERTAGGTDRPIRANRAQGEEDRVGEDRLEIRPGETGIDRGHEERGLPERSLGGAVVLPATFRAGSDGAVSIPTMIQPAQPPAPAKSGESPEPPMSAADAGPVAETSSRPADFEARAGEVRQIQIAVRGDRRERVHITAGGHGPEISVVVRTSDGPLTETLRANLGPWIESTSERLAGPAQRVEAWLAGETAAGTGPDGSTVEPDARSQVEAFPPTTHGGAFEETESRRRRQQLPFAIRRGNRSPERFAISELAGGEQTP
jgi:hypothetical protein